MTIEQEHTINVLREQTRLLGQRVADQDIELAVYRHRIRDLNRRLDGMREFLVPGDLQVVRNEASADSVGCQWCDHVLPEHVMLTYGENSHSGVALICSEQSCACISTMSTDAPPDDVVADLRERAHHPTADAEEGSG